ncbi:MAG: hypothetical protein J0H18_03155 [Rhizobiales bacterium]|nr:hypothetical protein [Hyphomicrobiales bacterium]
MNIPFNQKAHQPRPASPVRNTDPRAAETTAHTVAVIMARAMQDIAASRGSVQFRDLIGAGFTSSEIIEFHGQASRLATEWSAEKRTAPFDAIEDMKLKIREPLPNRPPMTENLTTSPEFFEAWGRYCAGRAALLLDPWAPQRERCLMLLHGFLNMLPLLPVERKRLLDAADQSLPKIAPARARAAA